MPSITTVRMAPKDIPTSRALDETVAFSSGKTGQCGRQGGHISVRARNTSGPDNFGSIMSRTMMSGLFSRARRRPASPSSADVTLCPAFTSVRSLLKRSSRLSSTIRIFKLPLFLSLAFRSAISGPSLMLETIGKRPLWTAKVFCAHFARRGRPLDPGAAAGHRPCRDMTRPQATPCAPYPSAR